MLKIDRSTRQYTASLHALTAVNFLGCPLLLLRELAQVLIFATVFVSGSALAVNASPPGLCVTPSRLAGNPLAQEEDTLDRVYRSRSTQLLWSDQAKLSPQGMELLQLLNSSDRYGLDSADYAVDALNRAHRCLENSHATAVERAEFDRWLSAAALRFATHLHYGRVDPRAAGFELSETRTDFDGPKTIETWSSASRVALGVTAIEPHFYHYELLKKALLRYRSLAESPSLTQLPPVGRVNLKVGDRYAGAPALRKLLQAIGDLSALELAETGDGLALDSALVDGLKRFQRRHGLTADGVLGGRTFEVLTTPLDVRVRQIELTLERWRWLPAFDTPPIIINIPQFTLFAFRTTADRLADIEQMPVIVGQIYPRTRTPIFVGELKYVNFRPFWDVPRSITVREMLSAITADTHYLQRNRLQIVLGNDEHAQVQAPSREAIAELAAGHYRLRQLPGEDNALGLVKFVFPNVHDVYLHSTPAHQLFLQSRRAFSHGCIRVSDPVSLAVYVLRDNPGAWDAKTVDAAMHATNSSRVNLTHPIKVMVLYATALALEDGSIQFFDDIYGHDRKLQALLRQRVKP